MTTTRRHLLFTSAALGLTSGAAFAQEPSGSKRWMELTEDEWRERLSPLAFRVLRKDATERAGTSPLAKEQREGVYVCAGCGLELFKSEWKYESGTGWPSFWRIREENIGTKLDLRIWTPRTEYHCARCGGHQGHVFDDGPPPTGKRWCNNGVALKFIPA